MTIKLDKEYVWENNKQVSLNRYKTANTNKKPAIVSNLQGKTNWTLKAYIPINFAANSKVEKQVSSALGHARLLVVEI